MCVLDSVPPPLADLSTIYHQTVANSGLVTAGARLQRILELETNVKRKVLHDYEHMDLRVDLGLKLYLVQQIRAGVTSVWGQWGHRNVSTVLWRLVQNLWSTWYQFSSLCMAVLSIQ